ncbi:hypothetical protein K440107A6_38000 [Lawsonibacter asaccharolyticus]
MISYEEICALALAKAGTVSIVKQTAHINIANRRFVSSVSALQKIVLDNRDFMLLCYALEA